MSIEVLKIYLKTLVRKTHSMIKKKSWFYLKLIKIQLKQRKNIDFVNSIYLYFNILILSLKHKKKIKNKKFNNTFLYYHLIQIKSVLEKNHFFIIQLCN